MNVQTLAVNSSTHRPHRLHASSRTWPQSNCYIDLWIELLHAAGHEPAAALPMTVMQDFEGDQFTFFKFPAEDLEVLFGVVVQELAIYDALDVHILEQLRRGRPVLVEVDGFNLPDTHGTSYRREHVKTTIGAAALDLEASRLGYFHNAGYYVLEGEDFEGVFRRPSMGGAGHLFPYAEFVKLEGGLTLPADTLLKGSLTLLRKHLGRRPKTNPIGSYRTELGSHLTRLAARPLAYFHVYSFNTLRQLGANFGLLGSYVEWLEGQGESHLGEVRDACEQLAADCKALQFQLARAVNRRSFGDYEVIFERLEAAYDTALTGLVARYG